DEGAALAYQHNGTPRSNRGRAGSEARGAAEERCAQPSQLLFGNDARPPAGARLLEAFGAKLRRESTADNQELIAAMHQGGHADAMPRVHRGALEDGVSVQPDFAERGEATEIQIDSLIGYRRAIEAAAKPVLRCVSARGSRHGCGSEAQIAKPAGSVGCLRDRDFPIRQQRNAFPSRLDLAGGDHNECRWTPSAIRSRASTEVSQSAASSAIAGAGLKARRRASLKSS